MADDVGGIELYQLPAPMRPNVASGTEIAPNYCFLSIDTATVQLGLVQKQSTVAIV